MALFEPDSDVVCGPLVPGAPAEPQLAVDEIQGAVLPGFGTSNQHLVGLRFESVESMRTWLAGPHAQISTLAETNAQRNARRTALRNGDPRPRTAVMVGVALSIEALQMLTPDADQIRDNAFRVGMALRSALLGDPTTPGQQGHRSSWVFGGSAATTPQVVTILAAEFSLDLDDAVTALRTAAAAGGATIIADQRGMVLEGEIEHFGFRDGISQIGIRGLLSEEKRHFLTRRWLDPNDALALTHARPGQPLTWPGQFIFGYPAANPDDLLQPGPESSGGPDWTRNGSLLVIRRLRQNVRAFRGFIADRAAALRQLPDGANWTDERLAATLVGRWPDGSALVRNPSGPDPADATDMLSTNAFNYANPTEPATVCADPLVAREGLAGDPPDGELREVAGAAADPLGRICPPFAHIRKVNPRDLATDQGDAADTRRFQMLRRGITWGESYMTDEPDDVDRGLLFMSYQTSIVQQFELLTQRWMNRTGAPEGVAGQDLLVGQAANDPRTASFPNGPTVSATPTEQWVIPTGGGYFFAPSRSGLAALANVQ